jgi:hypothetical protein
MWTERPGQLSANMAAGFINLSGGSLSIYAVSPDATDDFRSAKLLGPRQKPVTPDEVWETTLGLIQKRIAELKDLGRFKADPQNCAFCEYSGVCKVQDPRYKDRINAQSSAAAGNPDDDDDTATNAAAAAATSDLLFIANGRNNYSSGSSSSSSGNQSDDAPILVAASEEAEVEEEEEEDSKVVAEYTSDIPLVLQLVTALIHEAGASAAEPNVVESAVHHGLHELLPLLFQAGAQFQPEGMLCLHLLLRDTSLCDARIAATLRRLRPDVEGSVERRLNGAGLS